MWHSGKRVPGPCGYYADRFVLPLPPGHRFPMQKYSLLRARVAAELPEVLLQEAPRAPDTDLLRVHTPSYLAQLEAGTLEPAHMRRIGFPWSAAMIERSRRSVGATVAAARSALAHGVSINLAGGTHHAFSDRGEGYCVFNDVAVAIRTMQAEGRAHRFAVIDCDVHQGNGTAAIFAGDDDVFTFSVHGARNFPFVKQPGDLDIDLADGAGDDEFLAAVATGVERALQAAPELVFYVAGADPFEGDRLGRLAVTRAGLAERDRLVFGACAAAGLPVVLVMAGGYAADVSDTVAIHFESIRAAVRHQRLLRATSNSR